MRGKHSLIYSYIIVRSHAQISYEISGSINTHSICKHSIYQ